MLRAFLFQANLFHKAYKFPCSQKTKVQIHAHSFPTIASVSFWSSRRLYNGSPSSGTLSLVHFCELKHCYCLMQLSLSPEVWGALPDHSRWLYMGSSTHGAQVPKAACTPVPRNISSSHLHVLLPASMHCFQIKRTEAVQDPCAVLHSIRKAGTWHSTSQRGILPLRAAF